MQPSATGSRSARHPDGWAEVVLLADRFTIDQLSGLVIDGLATLDRKGPLLGMRMTDLGRKVLDD
jgi:hypothetical protein